MIRVAIAAPTIALRLGLRALLSRPAASEGLLDSDESVVSDEIVVSAEVASPADLEAWAGRADVLIVAYNNWRGLRLPDESPPALFLLSDPASLAALPRPSLRAWGVLPLDSGAAELSAAVRALHCGLVAADPLLLRSWLARPALELSPADLSRPLASQEALMSQEALTPREGLTSREEQILQLVAQGLANKQIAIALGISEHTVKFHISSLYAKLGASSRTEAVHLGAQRGLIVV